MKGFKRTVIGTRRTDAHFDDYVVMNAHLTQDGKVEIRFAHKESDDALHISLDEEDILRISKCFPKSTREINLEQEVLTLRQELEDAQVENQRYEEALDGRKSVSG